MLTAEQHALRLTGIGASEIGSVVGADGAWDSALTIWGYKTGRLKPGNDVPEYIELGNLLEPVIASLYTKRTGFALVECGTLVHPKDPLQLATPDRLVADRPWTVQIKKARSRATWGEEGTDDIPENILVQCMWELSVTGREVAHVPVLFFGSKMAIFTVRRDDEMIGLLAEQGHKWWTDHVIGNRPPAPDGSDKAREALGKLFPSAGKMTYPLGEDLEKIFEIAREYCQAREEEKAAKSRKDACGNTLRLLIGEGAGFAGQWGTVTWTPDANGKPSWKDIAEALNPPSALVAQHTNAPGRTLRVNLKGA